MTTKDDYLNAVANDLKERQNQAQVSAEDWPTFPVEPLGVRLRFDQAPYFVFPYSRKLMAQIEEALKAQGWELEHVHTEKDVNSDWDDPRQSWSRRGEKWAWPRPNFSVEFSDRMPGSVCQRKEIGQRAESKPVYDYACPEV